MSSVKYRQRLREREQQAAKSTLAGFTPAKRELQMDTIDAATTAAAIGSPNQERPATTTNVVTPNTRRSMTPKELQTHAKQLAMTLAAMPSDQYQAAIQSLASNNETLYAIVCDELENMNAAAAEADDDGHDLSAIATGP